MQMLRFPGLAFIPALVAWVPGCASSRPSEPEHVVEGVVELVEPSTQTPCAYTVIYVLRDVEVIRGQSPPWPSGPRRIVVNQWWTADPGAPAPVQVGDRIRVRGVLVRGGVFEELKTRTRVVFSHTIRASQVDVLRRKWSPLGM